MDLLTRLESFVNQRPGINSDDYLDARSLHADTSRVARQRRHALELITWFRRLPEREATGVIGWAMTGSRIAIAPDGSIEYTSGQCRSTEYRNAVCNLLVAAYNRHRGGWQAAYVRSRSDFSRSLVRQYFTD